MAAIGTFGHLGDGRRVQAVDLASRSLAARVLDHGARLVLFRRDAGPNVCVASDSLADYEGRLRYAGPIIGPVLNRIAGAEAGIGGRPFRFEANENGRTTLHSGRAGAHTEIWSIDEAGAAEVTLSVHLPDNEGGFPGNRRIVARYALEDDGLTLDIAAETDALTLMNPGLHGVWNPDGSDDWSGLKLTVPADTYLPVDVHTLPTGEVAGVEGTIFDHRSPRSPHPSLDNNYCFPPGFGLRARLEGQAGTLEIHSDAPGLQVYAGGREGIALEPQLWPDAPHHPNFPSFLLAPGETFRQRTRMLILP